MKLEHNSVILLTGKDSNISCYTNTTAYSVIKEQSIDAYNTDAAQCNHVGTGGRDSQGP